MTRDEVFPGIEGVFDVIYVDPPWPIRKILRRTRPNQTRLDYATMPVQDIAALPVGSLASNACTVFLWATQTYLPAALKVLEHWGFNYHATLTWDKQNGMTAFGIHRRTELLLIGFRGPHAFAKFGKAMPTIFVHSSKPLRHSEKPDGIRKAIEVFGDKRIELFARCRTDGWTCWGNEL